MDAVGKLEPEVESTYEGVDVWQSGDGKVLVVCSSEHVQTLVEHVLAGTEPPGHELRLPAIKEYATAPGVEQVDLVVRPELSYWRRGSRLLAAKPAATVVPRVAAPVQAHAREHRARVGGGGARAPDRQDDPEPPPVAAEAGR